MGLFEFVFGKGAPKDENAPKQAFYLSNDDAKSFGDIEYMRSSKTVKRTFAKKKGQKEHLESVKQISAMTAADVGPNNVSYNQPSVTFASAAASVPSAPVAPAATASVSQAADTSEKSDEAQTTEVTPTPRRKAASNDMDMFRNMAKSIRK